MIAPMKRFTIVVTSHDIDSAPHYLRKLGIAHIEPLAGAGQHFQNLEQRKKDAELAKIILASYRNKKQKTETVSQLSTKELISRAIEANALINSSRDTIADAEKELERIRSWGEFSPDLFQRLKTDRIHIRLFEGLEKNLSELSSSVEYLRLAAPKGKVRIAVFSNEDVPASFMEFHVPEENAATLQNRIAQEKEKSAKAEADLRELSKSIARVEQEIRIIDAEIKIESLRSGMPREEQLAYFSGYVPARESEKLKKEAKKRKWALLVDDPSDEETPPTKIENPPAVKIIQPVFDFLGTVPNYREYDISAYFLVFFSLFFAMIFGDGGYGMLLLGLALFMLLRTRAQKAPVGDSLKLLFVLSAVTIAWGFATASWFAIPYETLPSLLQKLSIPAISSNNPNAGTNVKIFCFILGTLQLSIAHIKNIKRDFPNPKFLAQLGSLLMVVGMFNAVLNLVIDSRRFPLQDWALVLIGGGFFLVFLFGNWNGSLVGSLIEGLKGIIPTFLGTVSVFADITSYIRLWAVGLAGLAISQTVNGMVVGMFGPSGRIISFIIGAVMGLVLLFVGHALNIVMTVLSVVVHGIRLNVLEFSSHLGMEWSGYKYEPLGEIAENINEQEKEL